MKRKYLSEHRTLNNILIANLILGILLWFGMFSNYELEYTQGNTLFPIIVGVLGLISLVYSKLKFSGSHSRLFFIPSISGGTFFLLLRQIMLLPPFMLATMFWQNEQEISSVIQTVYSPNKTRVAEVHFFPVGAYSGGNGRIRVYVKNKWLPLVRREVLYLRVSHADEDTESYLYWVDNRTLFITEIYYELEIKLVEFKPPDELLLFLDYLFYSGRD